MGYGIFGQKIAGIRDIKTPYTNGASQMKTTLCKVNFMNNLCGKHAQLLPNHQKTSDWSLPSRSVIHSWSCKVPDWRDTVENKDRSYSDEKKRLECLKGFSNGWNIWLAKCCKIQQHAHSYSTTYILCSATQNIFIQQKYNIR